MTPERLYTEAEMQKLGWIDKINSYYNVKKINNRYSLKLKLAYMDDTASMNARSLERQIVKLDSDLSQ